MADLIYFVDGPNDDPVGDGNAYAERAAMTLVLGANAATCGWDKLTEDEQDEFIKALTLKLDSLATKGEPVDDITPQPLNFPLERLTDANGDQRAVRYYAIKEQKKLLLMAMSTQAEADLQKGSISQVSVSSKSQTVSDKAFSIHSIARQHLTRFLE